MSDTPVLKRILVLRDSRLPFLDLDLADQETGTPLSGVCLMGPNGCGKSTLLARLHEAISGVPRWLESGDGYFLAKFGLAEGDLYLARRFGGEDGQLYRPSIEQSPAWDTLARSAPAFEELATLFADDLVLAPTPDFSREDALWCDTTPGLVDEELGEFLERCLSERREAFHRFLRDPENRERTIAEVERHFEATSPQAFPQLKGIWNRLLAPSGLRVEFGGDVGPFFDKSDAPVPATRLGPALGRSLLRTGLATSRGCSHLFLDEPEQGLHPALALDLIPLYRSLGTSRQPRLFVATQSPFVASCFPPSQRIRISVDPDGGITFVRGKSPDSARFEDLLHRDFGMAEPPQPPREPAKPAMDSSRLKRAIRESEDEEEMADLIDEVISIRKF